MMNTNYPRRLKTITALCAFVFALTGLAWTEDAIRYNARPGGKVTIAGTSTIHDWTMDGQIIGGFLELPSSVKLDQTQATLPGTADGKINARVEVSIPVRSLKSGHEGMDEVMQQAMNEKEHPKIQYRLTEMKLKEPHAASTPFEFETKGELVINGVTNAISLPVTIESIDKARLKVVGKTSLKMTHYQVKPPAPSIGLGLITTGDDITVSLEWLVAQPQAASSP